MSREEEQVLIETIRCLPEILEGQRKILAEIEALKTGQDQINQAITSIKTKLEELREGPPTTNAVTAEFHAQNSQFADAMRNVMIKQDDIENRSRRNNLLFFGIPDSGKETWDDSEAKVIQLCTDKLGVTVNPSSVERAHRIGKHTVDKPRPIIVKFGLFKDKQRVLSAALKLKGTNISISEDYSKNVRQERAKLLAYARESNRKYTLRYNKLTIDGKTYAYDATNDAVSKSPGSSQPSEKPNPVAVLFIN